MKQSVETSRKWQIAAAVGSGIFLGTFSGSIVTVALPTLVRIFDTDFATVQWVLLAYALAIGTLVIGAGRLGDILGRSRVYALGFGLFTVGSLLCGFASSIGWLIAARAVQGAGTALTSALAAALLAEAFPPSQRGKAFGLSGALVAAGMVLGPLVGGQLVTFASWRWIFFANVPLGVIGTIMVLRLLPPVRSAGSRHFDLPGASALFVHLLTLLLGLSLGQRAGFRTPLVLGLFAAAAAAFLLLLWIQQRSPEPMIPLEIFRSRRLSLNLLTGLVTFFTLTGTSFLLVFYLENVLGLKPSGAGGILAALYVVLGLASPISGVLTDRFGFRTTRAAGLVILLLGYVLLSRLGADVSAAACLAALLPVGLGTGIFISPNQTAIMGAVPKEMLGLASSLLSEMRTFGQSTGVAVLGGLWAARVLHHAGGAVTDAPHAPLSAQVAGFHETFTAMALLIALALALVTWEWGADLRDERAAALPAEPVREEPA